MTSLISTAIFSHVTLFVMTDQHTQFGTKRFIWDRGSFLRISNPVTLRIATWTLYKSVCLVMTHQHTKFGVPGSIVQKIGTIEIVFEDLNPATLIFKFKTATQPFCSTLCCDDTFLNLHTMFSSKQFRRYSMGKHNILHWGSAIQTFRSDFWGITTIPSLVAKGSAVQNMWDQQ